MTLKDRFDQGTTNLNYKGQVPSSQSTLPGSTLHFTYSINGEPTGRSLSRPSELDLNGRKPKPYSETGPSDGRY
jgi:hypothetical protein